MKWLKSGLIFIVTFLVYHIGFGCNVFPADENNILQAPAWYPILGISLCVAVTLVFWNLRSILKWIKHKYAQELIDEARHQTVEINNSSTVFDFTCSYKGFKEIVEKLIYLNEKKHIYMFPPPRNEWEKVESNIGASINDFISRAVGKITASGPEWADQIDLLLNEIELDSYLSKLLTTGNLERISQLRERAKRERGLYNSSHATPRSIGQNTLPAIDVEQIIREENEWRREQQGISLVDYELNSIDGMDGHAFEYWCAELLKKIGFSSVEVTQGSGDQGVDIVATKDSIRYAIQCKCYSTDLGNKPVQAVNTGKAIYHCHIGAVMANRYFTAGGREAAEATGVVLWDRDWIRNALESIKAQEGTYT